ncbi:hypothetical protein QE430_000632 [Microbacterium testaceum]|nr:hypothetical protein [Microbacterium testaceum]
MGQPGPVRQPLQRAGRPRGERPGRRGQRSRAQPRRRSGRPAARQRHVRMASRLDRAGRPGPAARRLRLRGDAPLRLHRCRRLALERQPAPGRHRAAHQRRQQLPRVDDRYAGRGAHPGLRRAEGRRRGGAHPARRPAHHPRAARRRHDRRDAAGRWSRHREERILAARERLDAARRRIRPARRRNGAVVGRRGAAEGRDRAAARRIRSRRRRRPAGRRRCGPHRCRRPPGGLDRGRRRGPASAGALRHREGPDRRRARQGPRQ